MLLVLVLTVLVFHGNSTGQTIEKSKAVAHTDHMRTVKCKSVEQGIKHYRAATWFWQQKLEHKLTHTAYPEANPGHCKYKRYVAKKWRQRAASYRKQYVARRTYFRRLYEKWRCIHEHEGAWNANTGNGYWGGLQMDWGFMHTYGPEFIRRYGLAHRWPVWAQLVAAERAYNGYAGFPARGFSPWGTRGMCGL